MIKLGKTKKALLEAALSRSDGALLPVPGKMDATSTSCRRALAGLVKDGLAEERAARAADVAWREEDGTSLALFVTPHGLSAVGAAPPGTGPEGSKAAPAKRPGGKLGQVDLRPDFPPAVGRVRR